MSTPDYQSLVLPALKALFGSIEIPVSDVCDYVAVAKGPRGVIIVSVKLADRVCSKIWLQKAKTTLHPGKECR